MLDAKLFGIREICDVVLRAKAPQKIGSRIFYTNEPVLYFDTLKTSTFEGAATTVYAQGGRGNARLVAWDGERTVTFTMEDALISPAGLSILTGAGLIDSKDKEIIIHTTEQIQLTAERVKETEDDAIAITLDGTPYAPSESNEDYVYVMILDSHGTVSAEPIIAFPDADNSHQIIIPFTEDDGRGWEYTYDDNLKELLLNPNTVVLVDYYEMKNQAGQAMQMNITPDKFGGTFYLEASTLWRDEATGQDLPAEFIIPKCKIQSNFTFNMSSSGDPSTFTFTMDALPDYTRFDKTEKVLASIQILGATDDSTELHRINTLSKDEADNKGIITRAGTNFTLSGVNEGEIVEMSHTDTTGKEITVVTVGKNELTYTVDTTNAKIDIITTQLATNGKFTIKPATGGGAAKDDTAIITVTGTAEDGTDKAIKFVIALT